MNSSHEKTVAFIVVRLSSSRFPAKQLRKVGPKTLLAWTLFHLRQSHQIDEIVLATVAEPENKPLLGFALKNSIDCFWYEGNVDHVTSRLCAAAEKYKAQICVLVSGDCPLIDGECIDKLILQFREQPEKDFVIVSPLDQNNHCMLQGISIARKSSWERAEKISNKPELKEHQFPVLSLRPDIFSPLPCILPRSYYSQPHRLSVDTWADYCFFTEIFAKLQKENSTFSLKNVVKLLEEQTELKSINRHVHQRQLKEEIPVIYFIAFFAHHPNMDDGVFSNTIVELGSQMIERKGWPVHFLTNNEQIQKELSRKGIRFSILEDDFLFSNLPDVLSTKKQAVHFIIDNTRSQFSPETISNLINFASSLIIIGEYTQSNEANVLHLAQNLDSKDIKHSVDTLSLKLTDFIQDHNNK